MTNTRFESIAEAERRAQRRLPKSVHSALHAGAEAGLTRADNLAAFNELGFAPHVADLAAERSLATTLMGQEISIPVVISPTGVQAVHPHAEVALARAAGSRGTAMGLSSFGSKPIEEVVAANPSTFIQLYWCGSKDDMSKRMEWAKNAGAVGAIVTLDWTFTHSRDWGSPDIPDKIGLKTALKHAPEVIVRPRYLLRWLRSRGLPTLTVPNMAVPGGHTPGFFEAYGQWMGTPPPSWADLAWLAEEWGGPMMIKGVMRVDDAKRAVDVGMAAISVSNHGGNNLDGTPASIRALPAVAEAVGDQIDIAFDGGIRRGSDVVKAVALGAQAVMIGRAALWGLAANGQAGVENVLDVLRDGIDSALLGLGHANVDELSPSDLIIPSTFRRDLGM